MEEIENQTKDISSEEVEELTLDSCHFAKFTRELKEKLEQFKNLCSLTLNDCQLKSLENFPNLPKLAKLELIDNQLPATAFNALPDFPELQSLSLGGNKISSLEEIQKFKKYTQIVELDFLGCDITKIADYRNILFNEFPNLIILDSGDKDGNEIDLDNEEYDESEIDDEEMQDIDEDDEEEENEDEEEEEDEDEEEEEPQPQKKTKK